MNGAGMTTAEYRQSVERSMSEAAFLSQVVGLARSLGWRVHHCRPVVTKLGRVMTPIQGHEGFPVRQRVRRVCRALNGLVLLLLIRGAE